jgi:hypothetical protein
MFVSMKTFLIHLRELSNFFFSLVKRNLSSLRGRSELHLSASCLITKTNKIMLHISVSGMYCLENDQSFFASLFRQMKNNLIFPMWGLHLSADFATINSKFCHQILVSGTYRKLLCFCYRKNNLSFFPMWGIYISADFATINYKFCQQIGQSRATEGWLNFKNRRRCHVQGFLRKRSFCF